LNPVDLSGYIVVDKHFNRIKFMSPSYASLRKLCWDSEDVFRSYKLMFQIIHTNDHNDFIKRFKKFEKLYWLVKKDFDAFVALFESKFNEIKDLPDHEIAEKYKDDILLKTIFIYKRGNAYLLKTKNLKNEKEDDQQLNDENHFGFIDRKSKKFKDSFVDVVTFLRSRAPIEVIEKMKAVKLMSLLADEKKEEKIF
jgi:hypothetical protein